MSTVTITHHARYAVKLAGIFNTVNSYEELNLAIRTYGTSLGNKQSQDYKDAVGDTYEVFCEYFYRRYDGDVLIGVKYIQDTSADPYQAGYDFRYTDLHNLPGRIQTKWKGDVTHKFDRSELGTFSSILREEEITFDNSILFTNLIHDTAVNKGSIFHFSWDMGARKQMRVFDQRAQNEFILRDPGFWDGLRESLTISCSIIRVAVRPNYLHQDLMEANQQSVLIDGGRGTQVCATGGGKSQSEYNTMCQVHFKLNGRLTILVAPTIDLVNQHFRGYYEFGFFHQGIHAVNFNTGSEPDHDTGIEFTQTTDNAEMQAIFEELLSNTDKHIHITTTYKSIGKLTALMDRLGIVANCTIFDEYQHLVSQKVNDFGISNMKEYLTSFPSLSILFYSASIKHGRILSALDETVFGPILTNISYKYLREQGILVPKLKIVPIRISDGDRIAGLTRSIQEHAKAYDKVDLKAATIEAAGIAVAYEHAKLELGQVNLLTFSERVDHCKIIGVSEAVKEHINGAEMHIVHAGIPSVERARIYKHLKTTHDNILLQHSCVTEGVDVTSFNAAIAVRSLGVIEMQQGPIGRTVRAHPEDTKRLQMGVLSLDDPTGWIKYSSTVYVLVDTDNMDEFAEQMKDLIKKLQFSGLTEDDYQFAELLESRHGLEVADNDWVVPIRTGIEISQLSLVDVIARAHLDIAEEERMVEVREEVSKVKQGSSFDELLDFC